MFRRNLDFFALLVVLAGMSAATRVRPPQPNMGAAVIRFQNAAGQPPCALMERILSRLQRY